MRGRRSGIAIILKSFLGDAVMALPMIQSLSECGEKLYVLAPNPAAALLQGRIEAEIVSLNRLGGVRDTIELVKNLRKINPEKIIVVNRSFRSALSAKFSGCKILIGHEAEKRGFLLTKTVPENEQEFEAESFFKLAKIANPNVQYRLPQFIEKDMQRRGGKFILIQPGARYAAKTVSVEVVTEVTQTLMDNNYSIVFVGGKDEIEKAKMVEVNLRSKVENLVGMTSFDEFFKLSEDAICMVGSDTGLMHLAAARHCPTVTVFGPNPSEKWGHSYSPHKVLQAKDGNIQNITSVEILNAVHLCIQESGFDPYLVSIGKIQSSFPLD